MHNLIPQIVIFIPIIILAFSWYAISQSFNPVIEKISVMIIIFMDVLRNLPSLILVGIIANSGSLSVPNSLGLIGIIVLQINNVMIQKICITYSFRPKNIFAQKSNHLIFLSNLIQTVLFFVECWLFYYGSVGNMTQNKAFFFLLICINLVKIGKFIIIYIGACLKQKYYIN